MSSFTMPIRGEKLSVNVQVTAHLAHVVSEYQTIDIYDSEVFGRLLLLDGHIQLTEFDEHAYHESLVQIPVLSMPGATSAIVIGGGDGGVLRELVKHPELERIVMVEIDQAVIDTCREHLPSVSDGAFEDPRVELVMGDAFAYFRDCQEQFDLVVADSTDVYEGEEGNLSEMLFTEAFYRDVARCLKPTGLLVTQADNLVFCPYSLDAILAVFGQVFPATGSYFGLVPSFGGYSGFAWASHGNGLAVEMPSSRLDLRYLTPTTWQLARHGAKFG